MQVDMSIGCMTECWIGFCTHHKCRNHLHKQLQLNLYANQNSLRPKSTCVYIDSSLYSPAIYLDYFRISHINICHALGKMQFTCMQFLLDDTQNILILIKFS